MARDIRMIDDRPVRFLLVPTVEDARAFPAHVVTADAPRASRHVLAVVLALLVATAVGLAFAGDRLDGVDVLGDATPFVVLLLAFALLAVNWKRGSWVLYPVALALTLPALVLLDAGPFAVAVAVLGLAGGGVAAWRGDAARRRRWARTEVLLKQHERTDAVVTQVRREAVSSPTTWRLELTVRSPGGLTWAFATYSEARFQPHEGDTMTVWYSPADPAPAVVVATHTGRLKTSATDA